MDSVEMKLRRGKRGKQLLPIPYVPLPPELLRVIFKACADPPYDPLCWFYTTSIQWIAITHVCRYWRSVALGYSDLWKRLRFSNPDATKEMIRRSKGANLEVIIDPLREFDRSITESTFIPMLLPELHRVSVLNLIHPDLLQSLVDGFVSAAPKLEYLYLSGPCDTNIFYIPDTIFSRETPALHSLELHKCVFTSPSPSSGTVSYPNSPIGHNPSTISQIVSFLRGTPLLHTLVFDGVLPFVGTDDAYPNLVLPKLSRLELTSSFASCTNFLEHIIIPVTTDATVTCEHPSQDDDYGKLFRTFLSAMGIRKANDFVISAVTFEGISNNIESTASIQCTITHTHQPAPTNVTFQFSTDFYDDELFRDIFNIAIVTLPLTNTYKLDIVGFVNGSPVINFNSLPNVHTIRFDTYYPPLEVVRAALTDDEHSHQLRSLRSLQFFKTAFSDEVIFTLMDGLKRRLLSGFPIEYIRLDECLKLKQINVMRMKKFVQDVKWDGKEYW
jgi:F-box-like